MRTRTLALVAAAGFLFTALAGCVSDSDAKDGKGGSGREPRYVEYNLELRQQMHHAAPGVMLMTWAFCLDADDPDTCTVPGPTLVATEGDTLSVTFTNRPTNTGNHTIHWHGLHVPWEMDGVPYLTQEPIHPGDVFTYEFELKQSGTYWYHCHVDSAHHIDMGMYGALIVHPADASADPPADRDVTLMLDDWDSKHLHQQGLGTNASMLANGSTDPSGDPLSTVDRNLQQTRDFYNNPMSDNSVANPVRTKRDWYPETWAPWDPTYDTFTINGKAFPWTEPICINATETLRMRFVNVGNTWSSMHVHGHHMKVTHRDGYLLESPFWVDTLSIGPGERYDAYLTADNPGIWMLHDHNNLASMNNHISPGGRDTMIVYEDFDPSYVAPVEMPPCGGSAGHGHGGFAGMPGLEGWGLGSKTGDFLLFG